jgi:zinc/manganese transport system permease protein
MLLAVAQGSQGSWLQQAFDLAPDAMVGGLLVAAACGGVGVLLRWRRLVWAGFAVPEAASVGTAFALGYATLLPKLGLAGPFPGWFSEEGLLVTLVTALAVLWLVPIGHARRRGSERAAAACFLAAATLSVLLVSQSPHGTEEVRALATGKTLLFLLPEDVHVLFWSMPAAAALTLVLAGPLSAIAFDRDHARAVGHAVVTLEAAFAVLFGGLVVIAAPRAGAPFLFACLTLPPAAAERLAARPLPVVIASLVVSTLGFLVGATVSVGLDLPFSTAAVGGVVVASAAGILLPTLGRPVLGRLRPRA